MGPRPKLRQLFTLLRLTEPRSDRSLVADQDTANPCLALTFSLKTIFFIRMAGFDIGGDVLSFEGDNVIILARREFPDWQVRQFCLNPIFFRGKKYYLCDKRRVE